MPPKDYTPTPSPTSSASSLTSASLDTGGTGRDEQQLMEASSAKDDVSDEFSSAFGRCNISDDKEEVGLLAFLLVADCPDFYCARFLNLFPNSSASSPTSSYLDTVSTARDEQQLMETDGVSDEFALLLVNTAFRLTTER